MSLVSPVDTQWWRYSHYHCKAVLCLLSCLSVCPSVSPSNCQHNHSTRRVLSEGDTDTSALTYDPDIRPWLKRGQDKPASQVSVIGNFVLKLPSKHIQTRTHIRPITLPGPWKWYVKSVDEVSQNFGKWWAFKNIPFWEWSVMDFLNKKVKVSAWVPCALLTLTRRHQQMLPALNYIKSNVSPDPQTASRSVQPFLHSISIHVNNTQTDTQTHRPRYVRHL